MRRPEPTLDALVRGVRSGDRAWIGRALSVVESSAPRHRALAEELLVALHPHTGAARRVGVTGVPGAGKSTFLDALGTSLTARGARVAVLAVDPSSARSGGSVLGDKTRMARLSRDPAAFIRPSPTRGALGGVADGTREQMRVLEAAGFDVVIVETVGVGQSETTVAAMVDTFVLLCIPNAGDELQGIKRGVMELAEIVVVHKADGERLHAAERARVDIASALHYVRPALEGWPTPVLLASGLEGRGVDEVWAAIEAHRALLEQRGELAKRRGAQEVAAMWTAVEHALVARLHARADHAAQARALAAEVESGALPASVAAARLVATLDA